MKNNQIKSLFVPILFFLLVIACKKNAYGQNGSSKIVSIVCDTKQANIDFFLKDEKGNRYKNIGMLKTSLTNKGRRLKFAMNAGMFHPDFTPVGLYISGARIVKPIERGNGKGNFYLKPNGVFFITKESQAGIVKTEDFHFADIKLATQSGPMLVIDGHIHPSFTKGSSNISIRNGVGILPDGKVIFAMAKEKVNLYDFADYFKTLGCKNALYLDGFVSKMYSPEKGIRQLDGDLGVIIGWIE